VLGARGSSRLERGKGGISAFARSRFASLGCGVGIGFGRSSIGRSKRQECICWIRFRSRKEGLLHHRGKLTGTCRLWSPWLLMLGSEVEVEDGG